MQKAGNEVRRFIARRLTGEATMFHGKFFSNAYNFFCLLTPANEASPVGGSIRPKIPDILQAPVTIVPIPRLA